MKGKFISIIFIPLLWSCTSMGAFSERDHIVQVVNKLFVYTDERNWDGLETEVFADELVFDMVSAGAEAVETLSGADITKIWDLGFNGIDAIHHQAGNYIVNIKNGTAEVQAYAIASHYKESATKGKIREFVGDYEIHLVKKESNRKIDQFKYNLKYLDGNVGLK